MKYRYPLFVACFVALFSQRAFSQGPLTITVGDQAWSVGRIDIPLTATGGTGNYTWSLVTSPVPGIEAAMVGVLAPGSYSFTVQVSDGVQTVNKPINVTVHPIAETSPWELPDAAVNLPYDYTVQASAAA